MLNNEGLINKEFYLVALPGLEDSVKTEITDWFPELEPKAEQGGVTVFAPLDQGLAMNLALRTPTRILLRLDRFRCKDFPKLFKKISEFPWKQWVDPHCQLEVYASTTKSRLKIKKRIEETGEKAWSRFQKENAIKPDKLKKLRLYIRILDDTCTLSLDTSGELLHKRGDRQFIGEAPLRETIAAALIQFMGKKSPPSRTEIELIDPMMGSGTFLIEGIQRDQLIEARHFAFENFTSKSEFKPNLQNPRPQIHKLIGFESDNKTLKAAQANLENIKGEFQIELRREDFFKALPLAKSNMLRWVISNPPYGERLKINEPLQQFYNRLLQEMDRLLNPDLSCLILPAKGIRDRLTLPKGWKILAKLRFSNGGIPVIAFIFAGKS